MSAYYNEIDPYAAQWLRNLIAEGVIAPGIVDERDIRDVRPVELADFTQCHFFAGIGVWSFALRLAGWPDDRPVWTGSCPCQPFSASGDGKGFADERHLWPFWHHLVRVCRPDVVFGEQVASALGLAWIDLVSADLEGEDYAIGSPDLCSAGFGSPDIRQRLWWVAHAHGIGARIPAQALRTRQHQLGGGSGAGGMADAGHLPGRGAGRIEPARENSPVGCETHLFDQRRGTIGELGHASGAGSQERPFAAVEYGALRFQGAALGPAEPVRGFWGGADWIYCRDGKYRPVEPGSFPLADGVAARVGRLRAYGNAIKPWPAAEFISAFLDHMEEAA